VLAGAGGVEKGKNGGVSSSSSASSIRPALWEVNRGGRLSKRLSTGSDSDDESEELISDASEDDSVIGFDVAAVFERIAGSLGRVVDGGDIDNRCKLAFCGRGLVCGAGLPWIVVAEDVRLSSGANWSVLDRVPLKERTHPLT
jgi:hypothetical protein